MRQRAGQASLRRDVVKAAASCPLEALGSMYNERTVR
jgi:hypothetical protein